MAPAICRTVLLFRLSAVSELVERLVTVAARLKWLRLPGWTIPPGKASLPSAPFLIGDARVFSRNHRGKISLIRYRLVTLIASLKTVARSPRDGGAVSTSAQIRTGTGRESRGAGERSTSHLQSAPVPSVRGPAIQFNPSPCWLQPLRINSPGSMGRQGSNGNPGPQPVETPRPWRNWQTR